MRLITPRARPIFPNFDGIKELRVDDEPYILAYRPDPEAHYEFIKSVLGTKVRVIKTNGKKVELDKRKYADLMRRFGEIIQASAIPDMKVIHGRL